MSRSRCPLPARFMAVGMLAGLVGNGPAQVEPSVPQDESVAESRLDAGFARNSFGERIYYEVHGAPEAPAVMLVGVSASAEHSARDRDGYVKLLGDRYRILLVDYPLGIGRSDAPEDPARMTAAQVCQDWLAVADAAGLEQLALAGYSWGGNSSLQAATRSERIQAVVVGGWPALDGPYAQSLQTCQSIAKSVEGVEEMPGLSGPPAVYWKQFVAYYRSLEDWPEREAVASLTCPRLNYADEEDAFEYLGVKTDLVGPLRANEGVLRQQGWEVAYVKSGTGHLGGFLPEVAGPVIAAFLDRHLLGREPDGGARER